MAKRGTPPIDPAFKCRKIGFSIPPGYFARLDARAAAAGVSRSKAIRQALDEADGNHQRLRHAHADERTRRR